MICPHCGENNPDNAKYCSRCSATLPRKNRSTASSGSTRPAGAGFDPKMIIIIILAVLLVIGVIVLISSKSGSSDNDDSSEEITEENSEEKTEEESEEKTEEETEETSDEDQTDWAEENGLTVEGADKTSFKFNTMKIKSSTDDDGNEEDSDSETEEEFEVSTKLTISESTENAPDNYKIVTAVFLNDVSGSDGDSGVIADGAFDRYTGTFFGFSDQKPEQKDDEKADLDDFIRITNGDNHYDIKVMTDIDANGSSVKKTITVICPEDYNGTVYFAGYSSRELDDQVKGIDFSKKLYTYDELPFMDDDHDMHYFTYQKTDSTGRSSWSTYEVEEEPVQEESTDSGRPHP